MKRLLILSLCSTICLAQNGQRKNYTTTLTYDEIITTYQGFSKLSPQTKLIEYGKTDVGKPLHLFVISKDKDFDANSIKQKGKAVLLINNGIHPGEPDGIDASIELTKKLLSKPAELPDNLVICIVPVYNVDGCLNRGKYSRANQNGPEEYGFRGNAQNLDLNRDFIKCDAGNTKALVTIFQEWNPDVFIDTHVSNGADYQYTMTLIATQKNKLQIDLSEYMTTAFVPGLYKSMKEKKHEMCPYVNTLEETPESGIVGFMETPRFSTGYAALFNTIGLVSETHMWKPYNDRVWATYDLLQCLVTKTNIDYKKIIDIRAKAIKKNNALTSHVLNWELDTTKFELIDFKGYEPKYKTSNISGTQRMYYDRNTLTIKKIKFYNDYKPGTTIEAPAIYIVPQAWHKVIDLLKLNKVEMKQLNKDTSISCEVYYIEDYKTGSNPFEGHYLHSKIKVRKEQQKIKFYAGDYVISVSQQAIRYVIETLEPEGDDSFFAWGFFDAVLQQKEWFSDYIFEEQAEQILNSDKKLKTEFENKKQTDKDFAASRWAQLYFIYQHSVYYEKSHKRYPVVRLNEWIKLPTN
jgi:hypothetical protein